MREGAHWPAIGQRQQYSLGTENDTPHSDQAFFMAEKAAGWLSSGSPPPVDSSASAFAVLLWLVDIYYWFLSFHIHGQVTFTPVIFLVTDFF